MSIEESKELYFYLKDQGYIDYNGNITEDLKKDLINKTVEIPQKFKKYEYEILSFLKDSSGSLNIKNKENVVAYRQNKRVIADNPYFLELWNRIKHKTKYSVEYDSDTLIRECAEKLRKELNVDGIKIEYKKKSLEINTTGIKEALTVYDEVEEVDSRIRYLPDILMNLQRTTNLTRKTIMEILSASHTLYMFYINPQQYMTNVSKMINEVLVGFVLDGVKYTKIEGQEYYLQEVFPDEELTGELLTELVKSDKSVYEYNRCDSDVEKRFAEALQGNPSVVVYTKLPTKKFVVPTPVGEYTPDWAVVFNKDNKMKLYFVVENKGTTKISELRGTEGLKVQYGKKRFDDVEGAGYIIAKDIEDFKSEVTRYTKNRTE